MTTARTRTRKSNGPRPERVAYDAYTTSPSHPLAFVGRFANKAAALARARREAGRVGADPLIVAYTEPARPARKRARK